MAIELREFASGDTDYIAKLNANVAALKAAIDALQLQAGSASGVNEITVAAFWDALFNSADCAIGPDAYYPTQGATTASVAKGGFYLAEIQTPVKKDIATVLNFAGQTAGTKYITISSTGEPTLQSTLLAGAAWSVYWSGSAFVGDPIRVAPCLFDASEATAARNSTALGALDSPPEAIEYRTLDDRLEAAEEIAAEANAVAQEALTTLYEFGLSGGKVRYVGCTVDFNSGAQGAIQIDFAGTIIGWHVIADVTGNLQVSISRQHSSAPPSAPNVPDISTDKISAAAPIVLSGARSAAGAEDEVATWDTEVFQWDVIQFAVDSTATVGYATVVLRIQETL